MAWSNVGPLVTLAPGATALWTFAFPGGVDVGLQIAGAHTGPFAGPGATGNATVVNQGKFVTGLSMATYFVTIRNTHPTNRLRHNLEGGGVT